jgi:predicted phosphoribosyltransferase
MFENRLEAGKKLAEKLSRYHDRPNSLILALPRGGIVVGFALHQALHLPLDVCITRKLRAPGNREYAMGAITETGYRFDNPEAASLFGSEGEYLEREIAYQRQEIERRKRLYRDGRDLEDIGGRMVLVVDDGIATGSTVMAAVRGLKALHAGRIVVAVPVAAPGAVRDLQGEADEVAVVSKPWHFMAVGAHYRDFPQVEDDEVAGYLRMARDSALA